MKQLLALTVLLQLCNFCLFAQNSNDFNLKKFQIELISEMQKQFPFMTLDTTLSYAAKAKSQTAAGNPTCYGTKKGGMRLSSGIHLYNNFFKTEFLEKVRPALCLSCSRP